MVALRWGVVGGGMMGHDFSMAIKKNFTDSQHKLIAIATRDLVRSEDLAVKFGFERAYNSYADVASDPDVDVVYIATIPPSHASLSKMMLEGGKHVFCERPMGVTLAQVQEVLTLAKDKKLFFMEGFFMRNMPAYERLLIETKLLGDIRLITGTFCEKLPPGGWDSKRDLAGGGMILYGQCLFEYANMLFNEMPEKIVAVGNLSKEGIDESASVTVKYSQGQTMTFVYNLTLGKENTVTIYCTHGKIEVSDPLWYASTIKSPTGVYSNPVSEELDYTYGFCGGLDYFADAVRKCIQDGMCECPLVTHRSSEITATVIEKVRKQLGVVYDEDNKGT